MSMRHEDGSMMAHDSGERSWISMRDEEGSMMAHDSGERGPGSV